MSRNFMELIRARWSERKFVCVGLDPTFARIPAWIQVQTMQTSRYSAQVLLRFCTHLIDATKDVVCAYKPNSAFFERLGPHGLEALELICEYIHFTAPEVPVILDVKRGDIGSSSEGYGVAAFDKYYADAVTVNPYLGEDSLRPFLEREDKGIFVLCRTSNRGGADLQDRLVRPTYDEWCRWTGAKVQGTAEVPEIPLYQLVAFKSYCEWGWNGNVGLVAGATAPEELAEIRRIAEAAPLLVPGVGAQGGDVEQVVKAAVDADGEGFIINSSRGIIYASDGEDFAIAARAATEKLSEEIREHLPVVT